MTNIISTERIPINVGDIVCPNGDHEFEVVLAKDGCDGCDYHCGYERKQYACCPDDELGQSFPNMILVQCDSDESNDDDEMSWYEFYKMKFR